MKTLFNPSNHSKQVKQTLKQIAALIDGIIILFFPKKRLSVMPIKANKENTNPNFKKQVRAITKNNYL